MRRAAAATTPPPRASSPSSSDPASHSYPTPEQTPVRGREIHSSGVKIPELEVVSVESIYRRRAAFPEDTLLFDDVPVEVEERLRRSYLCCRGTYYPTLRKLLLKPMISPPHSSVTSFFRKLPAILLRHNFITYAEEDTLVQFDGGVTLPGDGTPSESFLGGKGAARTKEPDFALGVQESVPGLQGVFMPSRPKFVVECAVSEKERELAADAKQWLQRSGNQVTCVVLVNIQEGPRGPVVHTESDSDSDASDMATYQLKEASFFRDPALTAQWAGALSAWVEIWRMNPTTGQAESQFHLELLPQREDSPPSLPLRREDLGLTPAAEGSLDEFRLNMQPLARDLELIGRQRLAFWRWGRSRGQVTHL